MPERTPNSVDLAKHYENTGHSIHTFNPNQLEGAFVHDPETEIPNKPNTNKEIETRIQPKTDLSPLSERDQNIKRMKEEFKNRKSF